MKWVNVYEGLPRLYYVVWIYTKQREVLLGCRIDPDCDPDCGWYSFADEECKQIDFWLPIRENTLERPDVPSEEYESDY